MPESSPGNDLFFVDGIHFASFSRSGKPWRMASLTPAWPEELTAAGENPDSHTLGELAAKGIWLKPADKAPALAVVCGGMGAAWPHMGRELYDNFPVCRAAMDKIAALADWDILSLLDEPDLDAINQTRLQIPYLFLLEYAQWSQFSALGLQPRLMSGHSIGELMALCFAGVYTPETAWHILDTRAEHIAGLERKLAKQGGMLAISGNLAPLYEILPRFSSVRIANNNTPTQVILSGPREELLVIRKTMRKEHIPALMLNMNLAFHHPAMRYLRDLSLRRLNALSMRPAQIPVLSCSKASLYPDDKAGICEFIADLDENMVDWIATLNVMERDFKISQWLELGPQEILCGLTRDNLSWADPIPASRKGREAEFMAQACARLYSLGLLDSGKLSLRAKRHFLRPQSRRASPGFLASGESAEPFPPEAKAALQILASVSGKDQRLLRQDMDLRTDLAIRSSRFPYVIQELEKAYNRQVPLEILFRIATIRDLLAEFADVDRENQTKREYHNLQPPHYYRTPPLSRWQFTPGADLKEIPFCEPEAGRYPAPEKPVFAIIFDADIFPEILTFLGASGIIPALPRWQADAAIPLLDLGVRVEFFSAPARPGKGELADAFEDALKNIGAPGGLLFIPPPASLGQPQSFIDDYAELYKLAENFMAHAAPDAWICHLQRIFSGKDESKLVENLEILLNLSRKWTPSRRIFWLESGDEDDLEESVFAGSLLSDDFWNKREGLVVWKKADRKAEQTPLKVWTGGSPGLELPLLVDKRDWRVRTAHFQISALQEPVILKSGVMPSKSSENSLQSGETVGWGEIVNGLLNTLGGIFPWLFTTGISDLEFYENLALAEGITRELRFELVFQGWMSQEGAPTLMAYCEVFCRPVAANGRMLSGWNKIARLVPLLTRSFSSLTPVWQATSTEAAKMPPVLRRDFLRVKGIWQNPQPVEAATGKTQGDSSCHVFNFMLPPCIADTKNWKYKYFSLLLDFFIAALGNIPLDCDGACNGEMPNSWQLASIGYVRFNWGLERSRITRGIRIFIGETWRQPDALRFNGQVESMNGEVLMTFHSAEIEKRPDSK